MESVAHRDQVLLAVEQLLPISIYCDTIGNSVWVVMLDSLPRAYIEDLM